MTAFYLVRHAAHDRLGRYLDGRRPGVRLSEAGRQQAVRLARRLAREPIRRVYASPLERAQETASPIAEALGLAVETEGALIEIDFGEWAGETFDALAPLGAWQRWNSARSTARTPAGDTMRAAQARLLDFMDARRLAAPDEACVLVSHADPLKSAICFHLGLSLDDLARFEVAPASVSRVDIEPWGARVTLLNETCTE